jgi:hypothetical protein
MWISFDKRAAAPLLTEPRLGPVSHAQLAISEPTQLAKHEGPGWNAYDIWHNRIRLLPGP